MERTILTEQNAHRATEVRSVTNPEWGTFSFHHNAQKLGFGSYQSIIGEGSNSKCLSVSEYKHWEITRFRHAVTLSEFDAAALSAFRWVSFDPETRAWRTISEHEEQLNDDLADMPEDEKERYIAGYKRHFSAWLSAQSRCASSAITGGSGFNVRRAEKANNSESKRYDELSEWREKALKAIARRKEAAKPAGQVQDEAWARLKPAIKSGAETIVGIDKGEKPYSRALFVSSIFNKVATHAGHGDTEIVDRAVAYIRELNTLSPKPIITERHKFFKLPEAARAVKQKREERSEQEAKEITFNGGKVVWNYGEDRLQIFFDEKPTSEIIGNLKRHGFKWAPSKAAWQRQLTNNAVYSLKHFVLPLFKTGE